MTSIITCDRCNKQIDSSGAFPRIEFELIDKFEMRRRFLIYLDQSKWEWQFDSTNKHFCQTCLLDALRKGIEQFLL